MSAEGVLLVAVAGLLVIAGASALAPRARLAAPLLLVLLGAGVSALPFGPSVEVEPEWILVGVLPPLLYSAAVGMPTMELRRELGAIGGLSVVLVLLSTAAVGGLAALLVPGLPLAWAFALGAVVSPTDAVATAIVRGLGVSPRVVTLLEGEGLLNDASALVLLRTAIAATAASVSVGGVVVDFLYAVAAAVVIGAVVGRVVIALRARTSDATVSTVLSFTVPFLASVPAEQAGASGLVAAVAAGLVTSRRMAGALPPQHRISDLQNWRTIELVLEGAIFLLLGLELSPLLDDVSGADASVGVVGAVGIAAALLATTLAVRGAYVAGLIALLRLQGARSATVRDRVSEMVERPAEAVAVMQARRPGRPRPPSERRLEQFRTRARRMLNDIDHLLAMPLGARDGAVVVWAGMRGAVTLAAAQTLPDDAAQRSVLVFLAFAVAAGSLLVQGATLPWAVRAVASATPPATTVEHDAAAISELLARVREDVLRTDDVTADLLALLQAQRTALLVARDDGLFGSGALEEALAVLDADQIRLELRGSVGAVQRGAAPVP